MATQTPNYSLTKDDGNEYYGIDKINANLDKIDTQMKKIDDAVVSLEGEGRTTETVKGVSDRVGPLASLLTTIKTNLVVAINEIFNDLKSHKDKSATDAHLPENVGVVIATQAEAIAGTSNVKYMTPLRVREAIVGIGDGRKYIYNYSFDPANKLVLGYVAGDPSYARSATITDGLVALKVSYDGAVSSYVTNLPVSFAGYKYLVHKGVYFGTSNHVGSFRFQASNSKMTGPTDFVALSTMDKVPPANNTFVCNVEALNGSYYVKFFVLDNYKELVSLSQVYLTNTLD